MRISTPCAVSVSTLHRDPARTTRGSRDPATSAQVELTCKLPIYVRAIRNLATNLGIVAQERAKDCRRPLDRRVCNGAVAPGLRVGRGLEPKRCNGHVTEADAPGLYRSGEDWNFTASSAEPLGSTRKVRPAFGRARIGTMGTMCTRYPDRFRPIARIF
jgi:hypothetical protein